MNNKIFIKKSKYKNIRNKNIYVLERKTGDKNNFSTEVWQFYDNFDKEQAFNFLKQWDNKNRKIQKIHKTNKK
jgi:hypothetical protein